MAKGRKWAALPDTGSYVAVSWNAARRAWEVRLWDAERSADGYRSELLYESFYDGMAAAFAYRYADERGFVVQQANKQGQWTVTTRDT